MDSPIISVDKVTKTFKLPHEKETSIKSVVVNFRKNKGYEMQKALNDVSFEIKKGEFFGIVGRNGSGKSTLLKILAGIYTPTRGAIQVNGSLTPFIELGVGFNPELTGRENIFLNGALLGFNRKEVSLMYKDIVEFAELERFMDQKLKNYSSGMQVRLAFSIAIRAKSDILLIDEVLAVGDTNFQRKCFEYFNYLKSSDTTVVFVSHDSNAVERYCDRAVLLDKGRKIAEGKPREVFNKYLDMNIALAEGRKENKNEELTNKTSTKYAEIISVEVKDKDGSNKQNFKPHEKIDIEITCKAKAPLENPVVRLAVANQQGGMALFAASTSKYDIGSLRAGEIFKAKFSLKNIFDDSDLVIHSTLFDSKQRDVLARYNDAAHFTSMGWPRDLAGLVYPEIDVDYSKS